MLRRPRKPAPTTRSLPLCALVVALVMNLVKLLEPLTVDDVCHHDYSGWRPLDDQPGDRIVVWIYRATESFHTCDLQRRADPWWDH